MDRDEYRDVYLKSEHWRTVRRGALERAGGRCQVCNAASNLDVHHRTYDRLGREEAGDLTVLCRDCHDLFHSNSKVAKPRKSRERKAGALSDESISVLLQSVPEPEQMWARVTEYLKSAPWSTASDIAAAVPASDPSAYKDWAYRLLARACQDNLVGRRTVIDGQRRRVEWALASPGKPKTTASSRADRVLLVLTDEPQSTRQIAAAADLPLGKTGAALSRLRTQGRAVRQGKNGGWKLKRWPTLRSVA